MALLSGVLVLALVCAFALCAAARTGLDAALLPLPTLAGTVAVLLVFAALPPAVLNYLVAEQYQLAPQKVASLVLIGNLGSLVVMPLTLAAAFTWVYAPL